MQCFGRANAKYNSTVGVPFSDINRVIDAKLVVIAQEYDKGSISYAEFRAKWAEVNADGNDRIARRINDRSIANAAGRRANAAMISATRTTTCTSYGNSVSCY